MGDGHVMARPYVRAPLNKKSIGKGLRVRPFPIAKTEI
jgi:hypothetical protein